MEESARCAVSVIIPTHNRERELAENLESVLAQGFRDYEVICVDDGSTDATPELLQAYCRRYPQRLRSLRAACGAPGPARNAGARLARGEWLLFTDDDVTVPENWIERMLDRRAAHGATALCGGIAPYSVKRPVERYLHFRVQGALGRRAGPIKAAPMMNFLVSRARFDAAGGFLEERLKAAEDWEFCRRLRRDGQPIIYDPTVEVVHRYQRDLAPALERMRDAGAAGVAIWLKDHPGAAWYTAYSLARALAGPLWIPMRYPYDVFFMALRMEWVFALARARAYARYLRGRSPVDGA